MSNVNHLAVYVSAKEKSLYDFIVNNCLYNEHTLTKVLHAYVAEFYRAAYTAS